MAAWSKAELQKVAEADDLHISPFREDGATYGTPTWIWSVAVDDALYVHGYNGVKSLLVSGRCAAEGGTNQSRQHHKGSRVRSGSR